ncbi:MAG: branched-chain amino acid ABC transporter permease [Deltaproteobacteria bacterium HGW-Deltaproteobacteria-12]|nr:MAG: branched-chain amino acid ABC transporter permease [Deltaproteobacteria bacterium HGW-Deltaproteobacteria-12]
MRFIMKTKYYQDIQLFRYKSTFFWYLALVLGLIGLPAVMDDYLLSQMSFIGVYVIIGAGLMLLTGYTGQVSLGHAAFFGIGAYATAILTGHGFGLIPALVVSGFITALAGFIIGLPALRLTGLYLAIATMAFSFIVEEILVRWESLTRGNAGMYIDSPAIGSFSIDTEMRFYYLVLVIALLTLLAIKNIIRSPAGRAMIAIRDSEVAAQSMGISLAKFKTLSFSISAFIAGLAGSLYAYKMTFINPASFGIGLSIEFLALVIIGGLGSIHGVVYGAAFVILLPQIIIQLSEYLPVLASIQNALQSGLYGLMIILFILFEPMGIYGRWLKLKFYFEYFPLYKAGTFRREKKYFKAERH